MDSAQLVLLILGSILTIVGLFAVGAKDWRSWMILVAASMVWLLLGFSYDLKAYFLVVFVWILLICIFNAMRWVGEYANKLSAKRFEEDTAWQRENTYSLRPYDIEAYQVAPDNMEKILGWMESPDDAFVIDENSIVVRTPFGDKVAKTPDWVFKTPDGIYQTLSNQEFVDAYYKA